ncbi:hypothetical protein F7725_011336, partial [Dissostichus mawsoni]
MTDWTVPRLLFVLTPPVVLRQSKDQRVVQGGTGRGVGGQGEEEEGGPPTDHYQPRPYICSLPQLFVSTYTFQSSNPQPVTATLPTTMRELKSKDFWRAVLAELVGMTLFIFLSISTVIGNKNISNPDQEVKVSLAFGLAIATLAQSLGHISGAHLNPAVTLGMLASCQISVLKAVMYIVAQMLGSSLASGMCMEHLNGVTPSQGVGIELLSTFQLSLIKGGVMSPAQHPWPLASQYAWDTWQLSATQAVASIPPAPLLGPALILNNFKDHWVYWVGPMCGGVAAALVYDFLLSPKYDDFPDRMKVLVSGPVGDYDVNGGNNANSLGMIIFIFIGLLAAIEDQNNSYPDQEIKVVLAFGLAISMLRSFFYVMVQIFGAVAGSAILNGISPLQGFGVEFLLTLQLFLCVITDKRRAIGLSVVLEHLAGISFTGCSINPARSLGPAIIQESFDDHWVYWAGPMSGGLVASLLYDFLLAPRNEPFREKTRVLFCCGHKKCTSVYLLGPMFGGIAAALIYDFLLYQGTQNFSTQCNNQNKDLLTKYIILHGFPPLKEEYFSAPVNVIITVSVCLLINLLMCIMLLNASMNDNRACGFISLIRLNSSSHRFL